jgi:hypothetical protein
MSDDWTDHDVTDRRLFCYASSLWFVGMATLVLLLDVAIAVGATVPRGELMYSVTASSVLLLVGIHYERLLNGVVRAIVWLHPTQALEEEDRA